MSGSKKSAVLVVGAGIGGIAVAARLARSGFRVRVFEKNEKPGGRCDRLTLGGYRFDSGATLFLMPELYAETYAALGERMEDQLDLHRIDPTYHIFFQDGSRLRLTSDMHDMMGQVEAIEPGSYEHLLQYLANGRRNYRLSLPNLVLRDFRKLSDFINPRMIALFIRLGSLTGHMRQIRRFFKSPRLQMAFTFQDLYMGLSPYDSPATYSMMPYTELSDGLYYPSGGMYRVAETLTSLAEKLGVEFVYDTPVHRILVDGDRAFGVEFSDGRRELADIVIANADLGYVYRELLSHEPASTRLERKEYGCSTVMYYWGLDKHYLQLGPHNLFLCGDYRKGFEDIFRRKTMPREPNFYIHMPARLDPTAAPAGGDCLYAAIPVGHMNENDPQDWQAIAQHGREFILGRLSQLGIRDLEQHIKTELSYSPPDWKDRYNLTLGSVHGLSHKLTQMAYFRPHNRHDRYRNLYFVGASTHPGTGIPTVLTSARLTADRILEENLE